MPSVSVVITTYNNAVYLAQAVLSVMAQTLSEVECIVVDDGSTDSTRHVITTLQQQHPHIRYLYQENQGVSAARNAGAEYATANWIQFLDADDWLHPDKLRQQLEAIAPAGVEGVVYSDYERVVMNSAGEVVRSHRCSVGEFSRDALIHRILTCPDSLTDTPFPLLQQAMLLPRSLMRRKPFEPQLKACEDREWAIAWLMQDIPFIYVPLVAAYYRKHSTNLTGNYALMRAAYLRFFERVAAQYPSLMPHCQPSLQFLLEKAIEDQDAVSVAHLAKLVVFPVRVLNGKISVRSPQMVRGLFWLRCWLPGFLLYERYRGPRSKRVLAMLAKIWHGIRRDRPSHSASNQ